MGHTRRVRHIPAITRGLITLGLLTLTGCTGPADPAAPTPPPTPPATTGTPSPTPTPTSGPATPTPPVMPDAAKAHTKAGAKAFIDYLWTLADGLGKTPDPEPMRPLLDEGCAGCRGVL